MQINGVTGLEILLKCFINTVDWDLVVIRPKKEEHILFIMIPSSVADRMLKQVLFFFW